jgi:hypothetical protein
MPSQGPRAIHPHGARASHLSAGARSRDWVPCRTEALSSVHREHERGRGRNSPMLEHHLVYETQCAVAPSGSV